jgi:hypothetical protein
MPNCLQRPTQNVHLQPTEYLVLSRWRLSAAIICLMFPGDAARFQVWRILLYFTVRHYLLLEAPYGSLRI